MVYVCGYDKEIDTEKMSKKQRMAERERKSKVKKRTKKTEQT